MDNTSAAVEVQLYKNKFYLKKGCIDKCSLSVSWVKCGMQAAWDEVKARLDWRPLKVPAVGLD